ncbi:PREDICTED: uncharacterized protein LOC105363888 [Ceratosolen solmsi marchali]|uniref:Uncharacterized protein LOC105363888 n=1 Tax=Ceratosolen solmsi marchali TaxID=326594 RepID=A0AAJ7DXG3_9HYME|nr:PREDICTED: uncharacterized protein LOC105363888 [Ceratosolen solmsi marchali]
MNDIRDSRQGPKKRVAFKSKDSLSEGQRQQKNVPKNCKLDSSDAEGKLVQGLTPVDEDAENQGFSEWLHSGHGIDTMRLFVIANSLLVFVTVAWPHMQKTYAILYEFVFGDDENIFLFIQYAPIGLHDTYTQRTMSLCAMSVPAN